MIEVDERGCGKRKQDAAYLITPTSENGTPWYKFVIDTPLPIPDGLDLINKAVVFPRYDREGLEVRTRRTALGVEVVQPHDPAYDDAKPLVDVYIWIGAEHYPYASDWYMEVAKQGVSRRVPKTFPFHMLTPGFSRMVFAHPRGYIKNYFQLTKPTDGCLQGKTPHSHIDEFNHAEFSCAFKVFDTIPIDDCIEVAGTGVYLRSRPGGVSYTVNNTGEYQFVEYEPRLCFWSYIMLVDYIRYDGEDGSKQVDEEWLKKVRKSGIEVRLCDE